MDDFQRYSRENEATTHALLSPFRFIGTVIKSLALLIAFALLFGWNALGWIVGVGANGYNSRVDEARAVQKEGIYRVDFRQREDPTSPFYPEALGVTVKFGDPAFPVYCSRWVGSPDGGTGLPSSFFRTSRHALERKQARMYEAYVTGAIATTALRNTLTAMRLQQKPWRVLSMDIDSPNAICQADPFPHNPGDPPPPEEWVAMSKSIYMVDAPWIELAWTGHWVSGMCLLTECGYMDYEFYPTRYGDLFDDVPPLSEHQTRAVNVLNSLATDEYWLKVAHANGIYDDDEILTMAGNTRAMIQRQLKYGQSADTEDASIWDVIGVDD